MFGCTTANSTAPSFGGFGNTNNSSTGGGLFGTANKPPASSGGGLFGSSNNATNTNTANASGGGLFGGNNCKYRWWIWNWKHEYTTKRGTLWK